MIKTSLLKASKSMSAAQYMRVKTLYAGVVLVVVVLELFKFEELRDFIDAYLVCGPGVAYIVAATAVIAGVLALPTLFSMTIGVRMRAVSMIANWILVCQWLSLPLWFIK
jgi:hypothetical protein